MSDSSENNLIELYKKFNVHTIDDLTKFLKKLLANDFKIDNLNMSNIELSKKRLLIESLIINILVNNNKDDFNQRITPSSIAIIFTELISLLKNRKNVNIIDLGSGSGNLIFTILSNIFDNRIYAKGIDNNESIYYLSNQYQDLFDLKNNKIKLEFNDVIQIADKEKFDFVVSDLPVGFYPDSDNIKNFMTKDNEGLTYVQNLFIEKSIYLLKENGFAIFLSPLNLFTSQQSKKLLNFVKTHAYIQGIINLPIDNFTNNKFIKNILILQKKGDLSHQVSPIFMYQLDSLSKIDSLKKLFKTLESWSKEIN